MRGLHYYCDIQIEDDEQKSEVSRFEGRLYSYKSIADLDSSALNELEKIVLIRSWQMLGTVILSVRLGYWRTLWLKIKDLSDYLFYFGIFRGISGLLGRLLPDRNNDA